MNGNFKQNYYKSKASRILKKRTNNMAGDIEKEEIVLIVGEAAEKSFSNIDNAKKVLSLIGLNPFNRNCLDHPRVLETAPAEVRENRVRVMESRGITYSSNPSQLPASMMDLAASGSGRLVDSAAIATAAETLNHSGTTTQNIMKLTNQADARNAGRERSNAEETTDLASVFKKARRMTANIVFGHGNSRLGVEARDEVQSRVDASIKAAAEKVDRGKSKVRKLQQRVLAVKAKLDKRGGELSKLTVGDLQTLCQWKKGPKSSRKLVAISKLKTKPELIDRYNATKSNPSPHVSPANSSVEEEDQSNCDEREYDEEDEESEEDQDEEIEEMDDDDGDSV
jgi:hypothetical protein